MFNKVDFANILKKINSLYENQTQFANASGVNRTYLSQYMNLKLDTPPSPKILKGIANASKGLTTYDDLMKICDYIDIIDNFFEDSIHQQGNYIPIIDNIIFENGIFMANHNGKYINLEDKLNPSKEYFAYKVSDNSMLPLLDVGDLAIVCKQNNYENGKTYLLMINDNIVCIRKIIIIQDIIELHAMNPYYPIQKLSNTDFKIIGRVIKAENKSAFK